MAADTNGGLSAPLMEALAAITARLEVQQDNQTTLLAVLTALVETSQAQNEMLSDILHAAQPEPGPSPVVQALQALAGAVQQLAEHQATLITQVAELPEAIGQALIMPLHTPAEASAED